MDVTSCVRLSGLPGLFRPCILARRLRLHSLRLGNSVGGSVPANQAPTAASKYSNTDRPCCVQVAITVQIRSHQRFPFSLLVPCVIRRLITTNRIACSAKFLVGSTPGVVMNRK